MTFPSDHISAPYTRISCWVSIASAYYYHGWGQNAMYGRWSEELKVNKVMNTMLTLFRSTLILSLCGFRWSITVLSSSLISSYIQWHSDPHFKKKQQIKRNKTINRYCCANNIQNSYLVSIKHDNDEVGPFCKPRYHSRKIVVTTYALLLTRKYA